MYSFCYMFIYKCILGLNKHFEVFVSPRLASRDRQSSVDYGILRRVSPLLPLTVSLVRGRDWAACSITAEPVCAVPNPLSFVSLQPKIWNKRTALLSFICQWQGCHSKSTLIQSTEIRLTQSWPNRNVLINTDRILKILLRIIIETKADNPSHGTQRCLIGLSLVYLKC